MKKALNWVVPILITLSLLYVGCVVLPENDVQNPQSCTIEGKLVETHSFFGVRTTAYIFKVNSSDFETVRVNETDYNKYEVGDEYVYYSNIICISGLAKEI